jgi:hypothetical protein
MTEIPEVQGQGEEKNYREFLYEAIQASIAERNDLEGSILLGYVIVAEWQAPNGHKWLTKLSGDAFNELPPWRERMFGHELTNWEIYSAPQCDCEGEE